MTPELYNIIVQILKDCLIPLLGGLLTLVLLQIKNKIDLETAEKYIALLDKTILETVEATNQTLVEDLKTKGEFNEKAQEFAKKRVALQVDAILTTTMKKHLKRIIGNLDTYIAEKTEAAVRQLKR